MLTALAVGLLAILLLGGSVLLALTVQQGRESEQRYRTVLENLPQSSVLLFNRDLRFELVIGGAVRDAGGLDPDAVQGRLLSEILAGDEQREMITDHYSAALRGESRSIEYVSSHNGREYWLRVVPLRSRGGDITGGMAVAQDITERRRSERERDAAEEMRRLMIDAMNEAYVAIDGSGIVTDWNARASRLFGYEREEAIGRRATELIIPAKDHREFDGLITRFIASGPQAPPLDLRTERDAVDKDGREFPVELAAATLHHEGQVSLHTFMHDISDRRHAQAEADQHASELAAISEATGTMARSTDPEEAREAICRAAQAVAGASGALLFEPEPFGSGLRPTAAVGADVDDVILPFVGPTSGATRTFAAGEPLFVPDLRSDGSVMRGIIHGAQPLSAYWVPVRRGESRLGVIVVGWEQEIPVLPARLARVMHLVAAEAAVAIDRAALLDRLARMARTDDLTGLPNRRAWDQEIVREIARARREGTPLTVAMVDLDFFKAFNDSHGHQAGDRLLKEAAGSWRSVLRETDLLARYGGEEFAIALPSCGGEEAARLIERLRAVTPSGESCSAGIATWDREELPEGLLGRADKALYDAKQRGRNRTVTA